MDRTKLEAMKTIDVAKRMIGNRDYMGARSHLLEVQCQFPSVHNISPMITACDILYAAELTLPHGETDWYWVLNVGPSATFSQIDTQRKKLTALLEGIKDDFPGANAALELVSNAFAVLSNKAKRLVFDSKRMTSWGVGEPLLLSPVSSVEKERDSLPFCHSSISNSSDPQKASGCLEDKSSKVPLELDEPVMLVGDAHHSKNVNYTLSSLKSTPNKVIQDSDDCVVLPAQGKSSQRIDGNFYDFDDIRKADVFEVGQIWAAYDGENIPRRYARINKISRLPFRLDVTWLQPIPTNLHEAKWCEAGLPVVCGSFNLHGAKEFLDEHPIFSHLVSYYSAGPMYNEFEIYPKEHEIWAIYKDWSPFEWCEDPESRKDCALQTIQIIEGCLKEGGVIVAQLVKVDGFQTIYKQDTDESCFEISSRFMYRFSHRIPSYAFKGGEMTGVSCGMFELDPSACQSPKSTPLSLAQKPNSLKLEWSAEHFSSGQVWAIYYGSDKMPRQYVVVNNVVSSTEVSVTFFDPHPIFDEEISWVEENLPFTCGTFRIGSTVSTLEMSKFSHLVDCEESTKIYPKKGEIWAMYSNWSSKWKQKDFEKCHYRIVEIMSDFSKDYGLVIARLEEVPGYKTFYKREVSDGFVLNRVVPRSEMLSFSHRVEAFVVPGIKEYGIPECSWHLEPDALPPVLAN